MGQHALGIYAENHGFGADYMWDRKTNRAFWKGDTNSTDDGWWWSGAAAPAWYTAGKSNIDVHCYWIPGCDVRSILNCLSPWHQNG